MHFLQILDAISLYGIFCLLAVIVPSAYLLYEGCHIGYCVWDLCIYVGFLIIFSIIGAKFIYLLTVIKYIDFSLFFSDVNYFSSYMRAGFVFYGGLAFSFIGCFCAEKITKINMSELVNEFIFLCPLGHGIGRLGCFFAGCCYGKPYDGVFHITDKLGVDRIPTQLIEAIFLFILFAVMYLSFFKQKKKGQLDFYLFVYSIFRFIIEFFRGDVQRGYFAGLSTSQIISLVILCVVLIKIYWRGIIKKTGDVNYG